MGHKRRRIQVKVSLLESVYDWCRINANIDKISLSGYIASFLQKEAAKDGVREPTLDELFDDSFVDT